MLHRPSPRQPPTPPECGFLPCLVPPPRKPTAATDRPVLRPDTIPITEFGGLGKGFFFILACFFPIRTFERPNPRVGRGLRNHPLEGWNSCFFAPLCASRVRVGTSGAIGRR